MTEHERDPQLSDLFAAASSELDGETFTQSVMDETQRRRNRQRKGAVALALAALAMAFLAQDLVVNFSQALANPLIQIDHRLVSELTAPLNSLGGLLSMIVVVLRLVYRKIFH